MSFLAHLLFVEKLHPTFLKPLIALSMCDNEHLRSSKPLEAVRYVASFTSTTIGQEAQRNLHFLKGWYVTFSSAYFFFCVSQYVLLSPDLLHYFALSSTFLKEFKRV
jgi:hypothetical protein